MRRKWRAGFLSWFGMVLKNEEERRWDDVDKSCP
jgi:hypothetical protein